MPAEWEDEIWDGEDSKDAMQKQKSHPITLRPPLYNAEDYIAALKLLFSSHCQRFPSPIVPTPKSSQGKLGQQFRDPPLLTSNKSQQRRDRDNAQTPPEMSMRKFLNGSELLFKLEADLRHAYPTFVQEFISVHCEGVLHTLEALKLIQTGLDEVNGLREQRKLFLDEQKCLQCLKLCLRNIEAVSKLSTYPGGLYPIAAAMVSTVTATRITALEIMSCICSEGGAEGHFKVSEAISTLRLRMGEPIRCKLLVGAISSAPPGLFQAKGIQFLTAWVASARSPKHKVHIQCELEEAGFNTAALRKGADLGGAREARLVQAELDIWDRISIDVDTMTRQNGQLRNSVATLQQELATLKDKLKRLDASPQNGVATTPVSRPIRRATAELVSTPVDSEEEAEQINQILEDLNNIVNSELGPSSGSRKILTDTDDIVPIHLVKSPPPKKQGQLSPINIKTRPWRGSSASDDDYDDEGDSSDLIQTPSPKMNPKDEKKCTTGNTSQSTYPVMKNVRAVVNRIEKGGAPKPSFYVKNPKSKIPMFVDPKISDRQNEDPCLNFHRQNHIANKFSNFKSSKLVSNSRNSPDGVVSSKGGAIALSVTGLRRSESLHTSLASFSELSPERGRQRKASMKESFGAGIKKSKDHFGLPIVDKWKSMDNLDNGDDNFTLRWRYPNPSGNDEVRQPTEVKSSKMNKDKPPKAVHSGVGVLELFTDYRQNRFSKAKKQIKSDGTRCSPTTTTSSSDNNNNNWASNLFSKYTSKKSGVSNAAGPSWINSATDPILVNEKESNLKMFSLPPIFVTSVGNSSEINHHRISDLPSGLY